MQQLQSRGQDTLELVVFQIDVARYALLLADVVEVMRAVAITPLPKAPPAVEGVIDIRGRLVPVFDMRRRIGLAPVPLQPSDHLIVARAGDRTVAFRADPGTRVEAVGRDAMAFATDVVAGTGFISGIARLSGGIALLHDLTSFLSQAEAQELETALTETAGRRRLA